MNSANRQPGSLKSRGGVDLGSVRRFNVRIADRGVSVRSHTGETLCTSLCASLHVMYCLGLGTGCTEIEQLAMYTYSKLCTYTYTYTHAYTHTSRLIHAPTPSIPSPAYPGCTSCKLIRLGNASHQSTRNAVPQIELRYVADLGAGGRDGNGLPPLSSYPR